MSQLLASNDEARLMSKLRWRLTRTTILHLMMNARLRVTLAALMSVVFWIGLFVLMYEGFSFLKIEAGAFSRETIEKVFNLFYASLMVMLLFSSGIIFYGGAYRSEEVTFLLTTPIRASRIVTYKFQEAILFSSWGFILLGSPMLVAYGIVADAPWYYFVMIFPFMISFVFVPSGIGAISCMFIVYHLTRVRKPFAFAAALSVLVGSIWFGWTVLFGTEHDLLTARWFENAMAGLSVTENRLFPSWWLSSGLLEASRGEGKTLYYQPWAQAVLFLTLLISNAMFFHLLASWTASRIFRASYSRLKTERLSKRRSGISPLDQWLAKVLVFAPARIRLLLVNDLRNFRRDPVQWSQFLIFFGLVGLYFLNVHKIRYGDPFVGWINVVSFLNLTVVGLILSTFTTRFIFPMISLEGRRFWILGLLPVSREGILWGKFMFAALGAVLPSCSLILLSDFMLGISARIIVVHQLTCVILCMGLSGIAVGLGACIPDLRQTSPSKIAAGFGGTLNLVLSACYILAIVGLTAAPSHLYLLAEQGGLKTRFNLDTLRMAMYGGFVGAVILGLVATFVPLAKGFRAFRRLEF